MNRNLLLASLAGTIACQHQNKKEKQYNILLITVDDMNYNSVGAFGCNVAETTPNIDKLASEGIRFTNAHVAVAVSQPCRNSIATGMYPHHSKLEGFYGLPDSSSIPLVYEVLQNNAYLTGILGKVEHSSPKINFKWDFVKDMPDLGQGRDPESYYRYVKSFLAKAKEENKPFYLMANSHDPHRPFCRSDQEAGMRKKGKITDPTKIFTPSEINVPAFLPDIPNVRLEISEYYSSVKRADDCVGKILQALKESGLEDNTVVVFLSDHGMALPFAKTNCYLNSTKTPMIIKWPGIIKSNSIDSIHFVSSIDLMPTFLEINGITIPETVDGTSIVPLLQNQTIDGKNIIVTQFFENAGKLRYPMRCIQNKQYGYIFNPWSNGKRVFHNESQSGRTFKAMVEAAKTDTAIAKRVSFFVYRTVEEFYDLQNDPDALVNLIDSPKYKDEINKMQIELEKWMRENNDPTLDVFINRSNSITLDKFVEDQQRDANSRKH